eukprot:1144287-Pelagomonas_calceolata.AAC.3
MSSVKVATSGRVRFRLQSSESQGLDQTEPQAPVPSPSVAEGGLPHESYSKFKRKVPTTGAYISPLTRSTP